MEQRSMEELEAAVERLLEAYRRVKSENLQLRGQVSAMTKRQDIFKDRLDSLLARIEKVDLQ